MARTGRPCKLTRELQNKIAMAIGVGAPYELASLFAGLDRGTVYNWLKKGEAETAGPFRDFFNAVKKAEGEGVVGSLVGIRKAGQMQWQALAWWLERKFPQYFALRRDNEPAYSQTAATNVSVQINFQQLVKQLSHAAPADLEALERLCRLRIREQSEADAQGSGSGATTASA